LNKSASSRFAACPVFGITGKPDPDSVGLQKKARFDAAVVLVTDHDQRSGPTSS